MLSSDCALHDSATMLSRKSQRTDSFVSEPSSLSTAWSEHEVSESQAANPSRHVVVAALKLLQQAGQRCKDALLVDEPCRACWMRTGLQGYLGSASGAMHGCIDGAMHGCIDACMQPTRFGHLPIRRAPFMQPISHRSRPQTMLPPDGAALSTRVGAGRPMAVGGRRPSAGNRGPSHPECTRQ